MPPADSPQRQTATIILHSGAYDRASYALSLALVALASGMDAHLLVTYDGLRRFTRGHLSEIGAETTPQTAESLKRGLKSGGIQSIRAQVADAKTLGLKIYACPNAMAALNISQEDLVEQVDSIMGLAAFLRLAGTAMINWYV